MAKFAAGTEVTTSRSRDEIERALMKYGATGFLNGWSDGYAFIAFQLNNRHVRITVPIPSPDDEEIRHTPTGLRRTPTAIKTFHEQSTKQRWRALALVVKAKLEAVESGISTLEREFLADLVLPNDQTVEQWLRPQIEHVYSSGKMPALLPGTVED